MDNVVLLEVFGLLKEIGIVQNEKEFCKDWLKRSESYMRQLKFNRAKPSTSCLAICASKLNHYGNRMVVSGKHEHLGTKFIELSNKCNKQINEEAEAIWEAA